MKYIDIDALRIKAHDVVKYIKSLMCMHNDHEDRIAGLEERYNEVVVVIGALKDLVKEEIKVRRDAIAALEGWKKKVERPLVFMAGSVEMKPVPPADFPPDAPHSSTVDIGDMLKRSPDAVVQFTYMDAYGNLTWANAMNHCEYSRLKGIEAEYTKLLTYPPVTVTDDAPAPKPEVDLEAMEHEICVAVGDSFMAAITPNGISPTAMARIMEKVGEIMRKTRNTNAR
jgi:hypothetical protein